MTLTPIPYPPPPPPQDVVYVSGRVLLIPVGNRCFVIDGNQRARTYRHPERQTPQDTPLLPRSGPLRSVFRYARNANGGPSRRVPPPRAPKMLSKDPRTAVLSKESTTPAPPHSQAKKEEGDQGVDSTTLAVAVDV
jgi:hypothetical protein